MAEPTSTAVGITAATIMLAIGPDGQHALIVFGGLVGVMHSVGRVSTPTKFDAAWYVVKWVLTAALLTGFVAAMLEQHAGLPAARWPGVVAFSITFLADRWPAWLALGLRAKLLALLGIDAAKGPRP
jgi:hypothetical protein